MFLIAHRGYHHSVPENTLAAFEAAVQMGLDGIETDARLSRDGQVLLIHDRVLHDRQAVAELTRREIEQALAHPVPALADALEQFPHVMWNVEIKTRDVFPRVLEVLRRYQRSHKLFVTSFLHELVVRCAELLDVDCGFLVAHRPVQLQELLGGRGNHPKLRSIVWDYNTLDEDMLRGAAAEGWSSFVYGAVTPSEHMSCAELNLAGLITDFPQYLKK
ncbi:MAG TPA: glycerophosphodiester phosphodiesterase [Burkholderiales bacterium]|nr:glycerophosphodiester phosphodiesterase [Burkholderiales bacterium]